MGDSVPTTTNTTSNRYFYVVCWDYGPSGDHPQALKSTEIAWAVLEPDRKWFAGFNTNPCIVKTYDDAGGPNQA